MPLFGATAIAILAFYPIAASTENAGEYCASLFSMVAISLGFSWIVAITVTPVVGMFMLASPKVRSRPTPIAAGSSMPIVSC